MLSMETCISPDGSTISYGVQQSCASLGLDKYHWWQMEPFHHMWMWMQTPAGDIVVVVMLCVIGVLISRWRDNASRAKREQTA